MYTFPPLAEFPVPTETEMDPGDPPIPAVSPVETITYPEDPLVTLPVASRMNPLSAPEADPVWI